MDEDQAGPDPGISRAALAGPDPEPTHDDFMNDLYPKNLEDAYAIGDQFINDKSTNDEPGKLNVEVEMVSMVNVPIYQASSSVPPLSTPVIDLSPPKPVSSTTQAPILTATTMTTTTPLPPPPQQQSITEYELAERVAALEKKLSDLEQTNKNLDNTTWNLGSRVYTLELRDLPHKIDEAVRENVKEAVQIALQAPLRDRFRDLPEEDMKECFTKEYPPPPPDSDLSKRRRHDTSASGSSQPPAPQSSAWKKSDTRDAPSSSSKQQSGPHAEKPVEDIPILDSANISDSEDTKSAHLLNKGSGQALSISKMKATRYHDFGLELLVPEHMWIDDLNQAARADHQEYAIAKKDFKNLYPNTKLSNSETAVEDFPKLGIESYQKQLNLTKLDGCNKLRVQA
ncbi:hypothetical protein Tco_0435737 [Tanacetum coccineum]